MAQLWLARAGRHGRLHCGERACIVIPLDAATDATHPLSVHIEGLLFVGTAPRNPLVRAWINGRRADVQAAGGTTGETDARFKLSIRSDDAEKARVLVIEFDVTDPQRPCDSGLGSDDRRLGFHLQRLVVRPDRAPVREEAPGARPPDSAQEAHRPAHSQGVDRGDGMSGRIRRGGAPGEHQRAGTAGGRHVSVEPHQARRRLRDGADARRCSPPAAASHLTQMGARL